MRAFVCAGAGFLCAVVWFDLMFDVQVLRRAPGDLPEEVLASVAGYYRRVTTDARPMNRLVAAAMVETVASIAVQLARGDAARWVATSSLVLTVAAVALAAVRTVPSAVRLGARCDGAAVQSRLARAICRDHLAVAGALSIVLVLQLASS